MVGIVTWRIAVQLMVPSIIDAFVEIETCGLGYARIKAVAGVGRMGPFRESPDALLEPSNHSRRSGATILVRIVPGDGSTGSVRASATCGVVWTGSV